MDLSVWRDLIHHEIIPAVETPKGGGLSIRALLLVDLFKRKDLVVFLISVILFHFGNPAMLPMAGQVLAKTHGGTDIGAIGACIIAAQLVMAGAAASVGRAFGCGIGRRPIFMVALIILPIRGILFSVPETGTPGGFSDQAGAIGIVAVSRTKD
jgi:MFS-type transporter involved in bile tolerance (Atg22 family)